MNYSKKESQTNRKVCFVPADTIVPIETRVDFSENEKRQCWYSKEEMQEMQHRCIRVLQKLEAAAGDNKKRRLCTRGLEGYTTEGTEYYHAAISACIHGVMDEQDIQWSNGYDDYDRLGAVSQEFSKWSKIEAIERGMSDEKVARKIHRLDQQRLSPPTMPKRSVSRDNLEPLPLKTIFDTTKKDSSSLHVDLGTSSCTTQKGIGGPGRIVRYRHMMATRGAKAA